MGLFWTINWWGGILQGVNPWSPFHHLYWPPVVEARGTHRSVEVSKGRKHLHRPENRQPTVINAIVPWRFVLLFRTQNAILQLWINTLNMCNHWKIEFEPPDTKTWKHVLNIPHIFQQAFTAVNHRPDAMLVPWGEKVNEK